MNKTLYYFLISIFMLANGSLFTWLFQGTPLSIWRQLIWLIGVVVFIRYLRQTDDGELWKVGKLHLYLFVYIVFLALFTLAIYNFNLVRLAYAFWIYFSGIPFMLLPFIWSDSGIKAQRFYDMFIGLGCFLTVGLVTDYLSGGFFTKMFLISVVSSLKDILKDGRFCFLSEAPTTFGVYYCFCLFCTLYRLYISESNMTKLILLLVSLTYMVGGWMTGSRQIVFVLALTFFVSMAYYLCFVMDKKQFIIPVVVIVAFAIPSVKSFLFADEAYQNRYSAKLIKKDSRYTAWERGFKENVVDDVGIFLVGKAVALSQGQKALKNELLGSHYENTYFSRLSEIGVMGIVLLLLPVLYLCRYWSRSSFFNVALFAFFLSYLLISYVSPNGTHQTTQMTIYLAFGLFLKRKYFEIE